MRSHRFTLAAWAVGLGAGFVARAAEACHPVDCTPGVLYPEGIVPSNMAGLVWDPIPSADARRMLDASDIVLLRLTSGAEFDAGTWRVDAATGSPVPFSLVQLSSGGYLVRLEDSLEPGATYGVAAANVCSGSKPVILQVQPPAPLPTSLGSLVASPTNTRPLTVATYAGSCAVDITAAAVDVSIALAADAKPWEHALLYSTLVDGTAWTPDASLAGYRTIGSSWVGRGRDIVYSPCSADAGSLSLTTTLPNGHHTVQMVATLPGSSWEARSDVIAVDLQCAATPDAQAPTDGAPDIAVPGSEPSDTPLDGGQLDAPVEVAPPNPTSSACSCRTAGTRASSSVPSMFAAAAWLLRRRRKREVGGRLPFRPPTSRRQ